MREGKVSAGGKKEDSAVVAGIIFRFADVMGVLGLGGLGGLGGGAFPINPLPCSVKR